MQSGFVRRLRSWLEKQKWRPLALGTMAFVLTISLVHPVRGYVPSSALSTTEQNDLNRPLELAQEPNTQGNSTLYFNTPNYVVSVYPRDATPLRMNVYNKTTGQIEQSAAPASYRGPINNDGWVYYESYGSRNAQNVIFRAGANRSTSQAQLQIITQSTNVVQVQENQTSITAINVPSGNTGGTPTGGSTGGTPPSIAANTILEFQTRTFSTRVFNEGGIRKLNVYDKLTQQTNVNAQPATLVSPPENPFQNWVSYYGGSDYRGIPGRYYVRVSNSGEGRLQFVNANGQVILDEVREGPIVVNIPPGDIPAGSQAPAPSANLDPYIAAVFGNEQTLAQVRAIAPAARFETAPQGRFINAGSFTNRDQAASLVSLLRSQGFDSRLVYRDFNYR